MKQPTQIRHSIRSLEMDLRVELREGTYRRILLAAARLHERDPENPLLLEAKERLEQHADPVGEVTVAAIPAGSAGAEDAGAEPVSLRAGEEP